LSAEIIAARMEAMATAKPGVYASSHKNPERQTSVKLFFRTSREKKLQGWLKKQGLNAPGVAKLARFHALFT
jgi:hypothetical protein